MTSGESPEIAAEYAAPWIERLARVGFAAKALLYGTVGALAMRMALGDGGRATGARGAMGSVQDAPFGRLLLGLSALGKWPLLAIAAGLIAYGAYELLNARYRRIRIT